MFALETVPTDPESFSWLNESPPYVVSLVLIIAVLWFVSKMHAKHEDSHEKVHEHVRATTERLSTVQREELERVCKAHEKVGEKLGAKMDANSEAVREQARQLREVCIKLNGGSRPPAVGGG